jgi:prolyl-tRNA synthetase
VTEEARFVQEIADQEDDFSRWYTDVVLKGELADYSPVRGCMVIRPYGYALWENMRDALDQRIKATGHVNAYFPLFIPESLLTKEAEHVAGFSPEVAWVTAGGDSDLQERLAVRPTSEVMFLTMYSKWIQSWRDLPMLINQWANVVRWEMRTHLFLRTMEFLWQEGHTAHRTQEEASEEVLRMLEVYRDFVETELAIPVIRGKKSEAEKFAGAEATYTIEAMMGDGKALQAGTSHGFGQHFAEAFNITFLDMDGERRHVWTTSWGVTTRLIGALIMVHGDERGMMLPPRVAPYQAVAVPIFRKEEEGVVVRALLDEISAMLAGKVRLHTDWSDHTPGWKFNEWELRGAPVRIEVGPRDVANRQVVLVRRDTREKTSVAVEGLAETLSTLLVDIQQSMFDRAVAFREARTRRVKSVDEIAAQIETERAFFWAPWCGNSDCEEQVKARSGATLRCLPIDAPKAAESCLVCGAADTQTAIFARSY